jgi:hypothetical protein
MAHRRVWRARRVRIQIPGHHPGRVGPLRRLGGLPCDGNQSGDDRIGLESEIGMLARGECQFGGGGTGRGQRRPCGGGVQEGVRQRLQFSLCRGSRGDGATGFRRWGELRGLDGSWSRKKARRIVQDEAGEIADVASGMEGGAAPKRLRTQIVDSVAKSSHGISPDVFFQDRRSEKEKPRPGGCGCFRKAEVGPRGFDKRAVLD